MKTTLEPGRMPPRRKAATQAARRVRLEYLDPAARAVCVAGSFNDWHPGASEMIRVAPGRWMKELTLAPGEHEYRLVVDGSWLTDPDCPRRVVNPFGSENSVLSVSP